MQFCNLHLILYGSDHSIFLLLGFIHLLTHLSISLCPLEAQLITSQFSLILPIISFMPTAVSASSTTFTSPLRLSFPTIYQLNGKASTLKTVTIGSWSKNGFPSLRTSSFRVSCAAKPETVQNVCDVVRKQLALPAADSKFSSLVADSLHTVEIVMRLEEEFGTSVEEESSENITTVREARAKQGLSFRQKSFK